MRIFPAIDIRGGRCVRLYQGDFARETIFAHDPVAQAVYWQAEGATALHVVDLDGARQGVGINNEIIARICRAVTLPVQVGGGLRTLAAMANAFEQGAWRVVSGSVALTNPESMQAAVAQWPGRIVVALDARDGYLTTDGWRGTTTIAIRDAATSLTRLGVTSLLYTNIRRDGTLAGPDYAGLADLQATVGPEAELIASGGIGTIADLLALRAQGIPSAIVGQALYTGRFSLHEAQEALSR